MSTSIPSPRFPRFIHQADGLVSGWKSVGAQARFFATTLAAVGDAVSAYRGETLRMIAQMGLGAGALAVIKAGLFGLTASLIACYKGISVGGGPAAVGNAVNETVVFSFLSLFVIDVIVTAVGIKATA